MPASMLGYRNALRLRAKKPTTRLGLPAETHPVGGIDSQFMRQLKPAVNHPFG